MMFTKISKIFDMAVASFALLVAIVVANQTCTYFIYQPKLPDSIKKLRKF